MVIRPRVIVVAVLAAVLLGAGVAFRVTADSSVTPSSHPLRTAVYPEVELRGSDPSLVLDRIRSAGASLVRITVYWARVAPGTVPHGFRATDPDDPHYDWSVVDREVEAVHQAGLTPYITVLAAPTWAQRDAGSNGSNYLDSNQPSAAKFGRFMTAIATRYDGSHNHLPRVRYWQIWNEPNLSLYLTPQLVHGKPVSPGIYRALLNTGAEAVKAVHSDNFVIAAGLAPFRDITRSVMVQNKDWGPLSFMRAFLCLNRELKPTCSAKVEFDAWAMHPYTSGGPTHSAALPNDVSLGNLSEIEPILRAAEKAGHIESSRFPQFWVTEFSWDSNPPDKRGVPVATLTQWVSEALYRMWENGVSVVTWFTLRDNPLSTSFYQSGLYYHGKNLAHDKAKPILQAFRFPLVGLRTSRGVFVWGRVPPKSNGSVVVEQSTGTSWKRLGVLHTDKNGIFSHVFQISAIGSVRARALRTDTESASYSLKPIPDHFYNPFGEPTLLEPKSRKGITG